MNFDNTSMMPTEAEFTRYSSASARPTPPAAPHATVSRPHRTRRSCLIVLDARQELAGRERLDERLPDERILHAVDLALHATLRAYFDGVGVPVDVPGGRQRGAY